MPHKARFPSPLRHASVADGSVPEKLGPARANAPADPLTALPAHRHLGIATPLWYNPGRWPPAAPPSLPIRAATGPGDLARRSTLLPPSPARKRARRALERRRFPPLRLPYAFERTSRMIATELKPPPEIPGIGGDAFALIAGPCAVESREQLLETAIAVAEAGGTLLRGGAYKPRTSPYAFQGLKERGLALLAEAKAETGLPVDHRGDRSARARQGARGRRRAPDRLAQHAELPAAGRGGPLRRPGDAQARPIEHDRRAAVLGRVCAGRGQRVGDAV